MNSVQEARLERMRQTQGPLQSGNRGPFCLWCHDYFTVAGTTFVRPLAATQVMFLIAAVVSAQGEEPPQGLANNSVVVASGVGRDVEEARKDACRNAVRQAVGALIDAKTVVRHDAIIEDKVVSLSSAIVQKVETIEGTERAEKGLWRLRVRAEIRITGSDGLMAALQSNLPLPFVGRKVFLDQESIDAQVLTQDDQHKSQHEMLSELCADFPAKCLHAELIGDPIVEPKTADQIAMTTVVDVTVDDIKWKAFEGKLVKVLATAAADTGAVKGAVGRYSEGQEYREHTQNLLLGPAAIVTAKESESVESFAENAIYKHVLDSPEMQKFDGRNTPRGCFVVLVYAGGLGGNEIAWNAFVVPERLRQSIMPRPRVATVVSCVSDREGKIITSDEFALHQVGFACRPYPVFTQHVGVAAVDKNAKDFRVLVVSPFYVGNAFTGGEVNLSPLCCRIRSRRTVLLSREAVKKSGGLSVAALVK